MLICDVCKKEEDRKECNFVFHYDGKEMELHAHKVCFDAVVKRGMAAEEAFKARRSLEQAG